MSRMLTARDVKGLGRQAGFDLVGIARAEPLAEYKHYRAWLARGFHGTMQHLERHAEARGDPRSLLPEAKSVIVCALGYTTPHPFRVDRAGSARPIVSRYAWGRDYHKVLRARLTRLLQLIETGVGQAVRARLAVDTAPLLERALAARAALGWIGKNNCLIHPRFGSFLFLGELLIDISLQPDEPMNDHCGRCGRCVEACPTGALVEPRLLDARRCTSYLTIEHEGDVEPEPARRMGLWVYGCDVCQEVCPWNRAAQQRLCTTARELWPRPELLEPQFADLDFESDAAFREFSEGTAIRRIGLARWRRNVAIARHNAQGGSERQEVRG